MSKESFVPNPVDPVPVVAEEESNHVLFDFFTFEDANVIIFVDSIANQIFKALSRVGINVNSLSGANIAMFNDFQGRLFARNLENTPSLANNGAIWALAKQVRDVVGQDVPKVDSRQRRFGDQHQARPHRQNNYVKPSSQDRWEDNRDNFAD
jgi:hypothetical protein